jgi:hypothetical protein
MANRDEPEARTRSSRVSGVSREFHAGATFDGVHNLVTRSRAWNVR